MASKRTGHIKNLLSQNTLEAKVTEESNLDMWEYPTFGDFSIAELRNYQRHCKSHTKEYRKWLKLATELNKLIGDVEEDQQDKSKCLNKLRIAKNEIQFSDREAKWCQQFKTDEAAEQAAAQLAAERTKTD